MTIIKLTETNVGEYSEWLTDDVAENIGRQFYRGFIAASDEAGEEPVAGVVYEILNSENKKDTQAAIRWLCIDDEEAGAALLEAYKNAVKEEKVVRSSFVIPVKNSSREKAALKAAGFPVRLTEGDNIIVSLDELANLPLMKKRNVPDSIHCLNQITTRAFKRAISKYVSMDRKGVCEDLSYLPLSWFDLDNSCYSEKDGEVNGLFLFHRLPSGMLTAQLLIASAEDVGTVIPSMMRQFVTNLEENCEPTIRVVFNRHNEMSLMLAEKLLPRGFGIPVYFGSREE